MAILEWGVKLCFWVRNIGSGASLKKGLRFRPKFLKEGAISLGGTIFIMQDFPKYYRSSLLNVSGVPQSLGQSKLRPTSSSSTLRLVVLFSTSIKPFSVQRFCTPLGPSQQKGQKGELAVPIRHQQAEFCRLNVWSTVWRR